MSVEVKHSNQELYLVFSEDDKSVEGDTSFALQIQDITEWKNRGGKQVFFKLAKDGVPYSSRIAAQIFGWAKKLKPLGLDANLSQLPENLQEMLNLALKVENTPPKDNENSLPLLEKIGKKSLTVFEKIKSACLFIHEVNLSLLRFFTGQAIWRKNDFLFIFADCSYKAVGIISLVSFLVGLILAFVGALQLRTFGAGIYVASMVSIGMTRIMAAIMVGIIMAGRTGASYAAVLGSMQVNEEIDALETMGIYPFDFLVLPRLLALSLIMPLMTVYADLTGILGGAFVGVFMLDLSPQEYFQMTLKVLNMRNILVGIVHGTAFGIIIALCGCYRGIRCGRSASSVGEATTAAVVTSIVGIILATAVITFICNLLKV